MSRVINSLYIPKRDKKTQATININIKFFIVAISSMVLYMTIYERKMKVQAEIIINPELMSLALNSEIKLARIKKRKG